MDSCKQILYKLLLTVILVSIISSGSDECVYLTNSTSLVYHLCGKGRSLLQPGTHLCLLPNVSYDLNMANSSFCLVSGASNITIQSASTNVPASITCSEPTGLGFYNSSGLQIENVIIHHCGGTMPPIAWLYPSNDYSFYFPKGQSSTLFFSHSANVLLHNVSITQFYGYGIVCINHYESLSIVLVKIYSSMYCDIDRNCTGGGTGLLLYFSNYTTNEPVTANISQVDLQGNDNTDTNRPLSSSSYPKAVNSFASCTAVLFSEGNYQASVFFEKSVWYGCYHSLYNVAIIARDAPIGKATVAFKNVTFSENKLMESKVGVIGCIVGSSKRNEIGIKKKWNFLSIKYSLFQFHDALSKQLDDTTYDHIFFHVIVDSNVEAYVSISLQNIYCKRSHFGYRSSIIFAKVTENGRNQQKNLLLEVKSFTVGATSWKLVPKRIDNNGKMVFVNIANVTIHGNNIMKYITGSVILACNSDIYLYGDILFQNNRATNGGAIRLDQSSHLFLLEPLNAVFIRNKAFSYGGAIYSYVERSLPLSNSLCAIQIYSNKSNTSDINIKLHFVNNTAGLAGNSMYVSPSYDCQQLYSPFNTSVLYNAITYFTSSNLTTNEIASVAVKTQLCSVSGVDKVKTSYNFYPGQTLTIGLRTVDLNNVSSYAQILTTLTRMLKTSFLKYNMDITNELNPKHRVQVVYSNSCTPLEFQILPIVINNTEREISLRFAVFGYFSVAFVKLAPLNCPLGFVYNNKTKRCSCSSFLKVLGITQCEIDNTKVLIPQASWLGLVVTRNQSKLEYCPHCPPGYCRTDTWEINVTQIDDICMSNHAGILCGQCKEGYSKVLFSSDCHYCNNDIENVSLIAVIVVTSILYVVLLFCFKFTINKGTIGGLVLWYDVISLTPSFTLLMTHDNIFRYLIYGISFTIYSLQIPLCVWNGFNAMDIMFSEYIFSFYLWLLVIIIILISRCSTKVSNLTVGSSVQVLMTLMLISFSNLLSLSLNILTPARIHQLSTDGSTSSRIVWFTDGSVLYGGNPVHIILMCISIAVILFFVIPFIFLGLFGVKLFRFRFMAMYLRPFIEALHGPYKDKHRYWFGLMLIVRTLVHIISASLDSNNTTLLLLIFTVVTGSYVLGLCLVKPYKNKVHNALEILFGIILLANLIVSSSASSLSVIEIVASVSVSCGGVLCWIILGYHIRIGLNRNRWIRKLLRQKCCNCHKKEDLYESLPPLIEENRKESND